jgi:hypothetical protein
MNAMSQRRQLRLSMRREDITGRTVYCGCVSALTEVLFSSGGETRAQAPVGYELALVDLDGIKKLLGQLPPTVLRIATSPDVHRHDSW